MKLAFRRNGEEIAFGLTVGICKDSMPKLSNLDVIGNAHGEDANLESHLQ